MSQKGTLEIVTRHLSLAIQPLRDAVQDLDSFEGFMYALGYEIEDLPVEFINLTSAVTQVIDGVGNLAEDPDIQDISNLLSSISNLYTAIQAISSTPTGADPGEFLTDLPKRMFEYLIMTYLSSSFPQWYSIFRMAGIIEEQYFAETPTRPDYVRYKFHADKIGDFLSDPKQLLEAIYGWGTNDFRFNLVINHLMDLLYSFGVTSVGIEPLSYDESEAYGYGDVNRVRGYNRKLVYEVFAVIFADVPVSLVIEALPFHEDNGLPGFIIQPRIPSSFSQTIQVSDATEFELRAGIDLSSQLGLVVTPEITEVRYPFEGGTIPPIGFGATLNFNPDEPAIILGKTNSTRLQMKGASVGLSIDVINSDLEVVLEAMMKGMQVIITSGEGDSFIGKILGNGEKVIDIELAIIWSSVSGINFKGGGGFDIALNPHITLGPLSIHGMRLSAKVQANGGTPLMKISAGANVGIDIGPFAAVVEGLGVSLNAAFEEGNAGPFDIGVGFKPPTGIGLSIDASAFKGGGFLSFDFENERYVGALELSVKDKVALKVIGVLTTKLPGNDDGYSLLLLITAEFEPINLGFGFTLNGVGGLIALNRTMNLNYLRDGVKANTLDNILFPQDPIANINQIISDLEGAFPVQEGRYAFGPMAIIGWGTPTLITIELGLMIEVPSPVRLAILGVLKAILPTENKQLLKLQVNFLGAIDFEAKFITFDASIFESKLLSFTLEGDMAFRLKYGDNKNFLFSLGGFHPAYTPPPLQLPTLRRLTINLLGGDNPRLTLTSYFAITSNTVQFGSAVDFYYKITNKWSVVGYLGFDILIQFNPFYLNAAIAAQIALMKNGETVLGIYLGGSVSGPAPWHVQGKAEVEICGITLKANFDKTFGDPATSTLPDINVLPKLEEALQNKANWQASVPPNSNLLVSMRELDNAPGKVVAHPFGSLGVSQKVVPLDMAFNKFGTQRPADYQKFEIDIADSLGDNFEEVTLQDFFPPAEFLQLSDSAKLSRKSFEEFNSGVSIKASNKLKSSYLMERELEFETVIMDSRNKPEKLTVLTKEKAVSFRVLTKNGSAAKSKLGSKSKPLSENAPPKVLPKQEKFAIAKTEDLSHYNSLEAGSEAEARVMLEELLNNNPALTDQIQVVPLYEIA